MDIKSHLKTIIISVIAVALVILMIVFFNTADKPQPQHQESDKTQQADTPQQIAEEWDEEEEETDDFEKETVTDHEVTDAGTVINNHFIALSRGDKQLLRNTIADMMRTYIGIPDATPADVEKYMNSLHTSGSQDISYMIKHLIVNKDVDGGIYKASFSLIQIVHQGEKAIEHTFVGRSEINREGKMTALILTQQS